METLDPTRSTEATRSPLNPKELVAGVLNLISLPEICIRINSALDNPYHNSKMLGEIISHDPALTARILRIVNSAYYGFPNKIELVSRAINIIGEDDLRSLVLATSALEVFNRMPNQLLNMELFWQHSIFTGVVSRLLAKECHVLHTERLFIAGLLHDIGKLILYYKEPDRSEEVLDMAAQSGCKVREAEQRILGCTHADVGATLAEAWQLPDSLMQIIRYHHEPAIANPFTLETAIVHIANAIVNTLSPDIPTDENLLYHATDFDPATLNIATIDLTKMPDLVSEAQQQTHEVLNIMFPMY